jgi:peroxiredoxin Q/BCP
MAAKKLTRASAPRKSSAKSRAKISENTPRKTPPKSAAKATASAGTTKAAKAEKPKTPAAASGTPAPGAKAPPFTLPRDGGGRISLADFAGQKLVLYFYPRADTPGCTKEAIDFSRLADDFKRAGTQVVGVSADAVAAQDKFKAKYDLSVALASDETCGMLEAYGVWQEKSLYGRQFMGIARTTFLIGPDARIVRVWPRVSVNGHAEEVLAAAREL